MGRPKKYFTEEEKLTAKRETKRRWRKKHPEYDKQWYQEHKEEKAEYHKQWYHENKGKRTEQIKQWHKQYNKTPMGRAGNLLQAYKQADKNTGRGECTIPNAQWIVNNIFTQKCHWCPETDWREMGCDRIDNSLPHTPDNVIPCCEACNKKRGTKTYEDFKLTILNFKL